MNFDFCKKCGSGSEPGLEVLKDGVLCLACYFAQQGSFQQTKCGESSVAEPLSQQSSGGRFLKEIEDLRFLALPEDDPIFTARDSLGYEGINIKSSKAEFNRMIEEAEHENASRLAEKPFRSSVVFVEDRIF